MSLHPLWVGLILARTQLHIHAVPATGLFTVTGWLEHVDTRIQISEGEEHARTPTLAAFFGSRASNRKSSMHKWLLQELLDIDTLPHGVKGSAAIATDATIKGHRNNLYSYRRSGRPLFDGAERDLQDVVDRPIHPASQAGGQVSHQQVRALRARCLPHRSNGGRQLQL